MDKKGKGRERKGLSNKIRDNNEGGKGEKKKTQSAKMIRHDRAKITRNQECLLHKRKKIAANAFPD